MDTKDAGRMGGQSKSEAKIAASRENGKKGGKPKVLKIYNYLGQPRDVRVEASSMKQAIDKVEAVVYMPRNWIRERISCLGEVSPHHPLD